jgi:YVTN family beta-propeller protein
MSMQKPFGKPVYLWMLTVVLVVAANAPAQTGSSSADTDTVTPQPHRPASYWKDTLPEGKGRQLVINKCSFCHDLQRAIAFSRTKEQWQEIVGAMSGRGAAIQPDEFATLVDYLTENFGPTSAPRGLTAMQPCKPSEWPKGSPDFRKPWGNSYTIWASDQQGGTVDIINPQLNKVVRRIHCISAPDRVEFSPDGNTAYIPDRVEHNITIVDTRTGAIEKKVPLSDRPNTAVLSRDGKKLIASIWPVRPDEGARGRLEILDTSTLTIVRTMDEPAGIHDTWMAKDGKMFLAMSGPAAMHPGANKFMNAYDTETEKLLWTCCTEDGIGTMEMEKGPDGSTSRIFVSYGRYPGIVVFDGKTGKELTRVKFPTDTDGPFAGLEPNAFHGNEVSPDGKSVWFVAQDAARPGMNIAYRYSLPELHPLGHIHLAAVDQMGQPFAVPVEGSWVTISPDGSTVYAARPGRNLIAVVDVATMKEVARIPTGEYPLHIAIWPRGTP